MRIHLIAIGGSVMHNLAIALKQAGHTVSGSDDEIFEPALSRLKEHNLLPYVMGWDDTRITPDLDCVIAGMHAKSDNQELVKAVEMGLSVMSYPEFIYQQSKDKKRVVVGGSHGKTTTTAMIMHALKQAGIDFDYAVGAQLPGFDIMIRLTAGAPYIIIEGDEYPDSAINKTPKFLVYKGDIGIITGIAWDHVNVFKTFEAYKDIFSQFCSELPAGAPLIYNDEDTEVKLVAMAHKSTLTLMPYDTPTYKTEGNKMYIVYESSNYPLGFFGRHNLLNMMAAKQACSLMGVSENSFFTSMATFTGAAKRLEKIAESKQCVVYRDFAHAPSKVKATVEAVKEMYPLRRCICCLEIHTYSSLDPAFLPQYKNTLAGGDVRAVYYSPKALEIKKLPGITIAQVKAAFDDTDLQVFDDKQNFESFLRRQDYGNAVLLLMSSGNYDELDMKQIAYQLIA